MRERKRWFFEKTLGRYEIGVCALACWWTCSSWRAGAVLALLLLVLSSMQVLRNACIFLAGILWAAAAEEGVYFALVLMSPQHATGARVLSVCAGWLLFTGYAAGRSRPPRREPEPKETPKAESEPPAEAKTVFDPYGVLQVNREATKAEIKAAYRRQMALYHPDKVQHLGSELQDVARERTLAIRRAFDLLCA